MASSTRGCFIFLCPFHSLLQHIRYYMYKSNDVMFTLHNNKLSVFSLMKIFSAHSTQNFCCCHEYDDFHKIIFIFFDCENVDFFDIFIWIIHGSTRKMWQWCSFGGLKNVWEFFSFGKMILSIFWSFDGKLNCKFLVAHFKIFQSLVCFCLRVISSCLGSTLQLHIKSQFIII